METLPVKLFEDSFGPFLALLNEHGVKYQVRKARPGVFMAAGTTIEIVQQAIGNAAMWGAFATVVVAYINRRRGRKVIITTKENTIIHAEGLSERELDRILENAKNVIAFDPNKPEDGSKAQRDPPHQES